MSIGEVLAQLRAEFPDTTISKLRFLEAEGLVEPQRTAVRATASTRWTDVARLRFVLTAQRDQYLPLRVIREQLDAMDRGERVSAPAAAAAGRRRCGHGATAPAGRRPTPGSPRGRAVSSAPGIDRGAAGRAGAARPGRGPAAGGWYDARRAGRSPRSAARLAEYGVEAAAPAGVPGRRGPRGRPVRPAAWRRWRASSDPAARARAAETVRELAALSQRLHAALVRSGCATTLGR